MALWTVKMTKPAESEFKKLIKNKLISSDDLIVIKAWVSEMEDEGPEITLYIRSGKVLDPPVLVFQGGLSIK
jgi:hypothetical protein